MPETSELNALITREHFLEEATRLRTVAVFKHQAAPIKSTWDSFTRQSSQSKNQVMRALQSDLQFLDTMCKQAGEGSIFAEEEPIVIKQIANE